MRGLQDGQVCMRGGLHEGVALREVCMRDGLHEGRGYIRECCMKGYMKKGCMQRAA